MNCEHTNTHPLWLDGLCIDCWKARAEEWERKAHEYYSIVKESAAELETRKRCHRENEAAFQQMLERAVKAEDKLKDSHKVITGLVERVAQAEAACAEMRAALSLVVTHMLCDCDQCIATRHALSTDAGKDFVPRAMSDAKIEQLEELLRSERSVAARMLDAAKSELDELKAQLALAVEGFEKIDCDCEEMWAGGKKPEVSHHHSQCNYRIAREYLSKLKEDKV